VDLGVSGSKASRPGLDKLMKDARERRFEVVLVYKIDRFGRSMADLISNVGILTANKIRFIAVSQGIDTDQNSPTGRLLLNLLGSFAEFERELISERVRSGLGHARRNGKVLGRPRKVFRRDLAGQMRAKGVSYEKIAAKFDVSPRTVKRVLDQ